MRPVGLRSAIKGRAVPWVSGSGGRHEGHFAITLVPSRRNASKTPCASRDPYPWPDSSCGISVWSRATRLLVRDCERAVAEGHFKQAHCWIVPDAAAASGGPCVWTNGDGLWIPGATLSHSDRNLFRSDVVEGLSHLQKTIPCR